VGSLQQAFEELKEKLSKEGLFDPARKRPLPMLPLCIGIVTSPTGAVVQDILRVLQRRYANLGVLVYPARVQGAEAAYEIVQGIRALNRFKGVDVLMVARGGGSLEDLLPFNDEMVARALATSRVPTLSAVGHETDFTIADFVADFRAPTPSAAAERLVHAKDEIGARLDGLRRRADSAVGLRLTRLRARVGTVTQHRVFEAERGRLRNHAQRVDGLLRQAASALLRRGDRAREALRRGQAQLDAFHWERQLSGRRERVANLERRLDGAARGRVEGRRSSLARAAGKLDSLSPLAVLSRGYALAFDGGGRLLRTSAEIEVGADVSVRLAEGGLTARVTAKEPR
jgi:exodeoxyribonuclease VII large subunit